MGLYTMPMPLYEIFQWLYLIFMAVTNFFLIRWDCYSSDLPSLLQLLFISGGASGILAFTVSILGYRVYYEIHFFYGLVSYVWRRRR